MQILGCYKRVTTGSKAEELLGLARGELWTTPPISLVAREPYVIRKSSFIQNLLEYRLLLSNWFPFTIYVSVHMSYSLCFQSTLCHSSFHSSHSLPVDPHSSSCFLSLEHKEGTEKLVGKERYTFHSRQAFI